MKKKICLISSSGGHWEELMCLKEIADENDSFFVTENGGQINGFNKNYKLYTFEKIDRKQRGFIKAFIKLCLFAHSVLKKEKPDAIITTGALLAYPFCVLGKLTRIKIVYIESFARIEELSLTGKLVYPFADVFIVQWEGLKQKYKKAKYFGGIF